MYLPGSHVPQPPHMAVPADLRPRNAVETFDLRKESMTESKAQQQLSSYTVVRIEKVKDTSEVDEAGYPIEPTWKHANLYYQTDISQQAVVRKVRELAAFDMPVESKKLELGEPVQRQIEHAQERLQATELDQRYFYTLSQFESKFRKINTASTYVTARKKGKKVVHEWKTTKKSKSSKKKERVAVTAYFERAPRPGQDVIGMLRERDHEFQMSTMQHPQAMQAFQMHQENQFRQSSVPPRPPPPPMMRPAACRFDALPGNKGALKETQAKHNKPNIQVIPENSRGGRRGSSSHGSRTSVSSDESFSEGDGLTPTSSGRSSSPSFHIRRRGRSRRRSRVVFPEAFGLEVPRRHTKNDHEDLVPGFSPPGPREFARQQNHEISRQQGYLEGLEQGASLERKSKRLPVRVIQEYPGSRRVAAHEARQKIFNDEMDQVEDGLERLRLEDEQRLERRRRFEQEILLRREQEELLRARHLQDSLRDRHVGERFSPEPRASWSEQEAREYMDYSDEPVGERQPNPFGSRHSHYALHRP